MSRRRWVYRQNEETGRTEAIEVTPDWTDAPQGRAPVTDLYMDGVRTTDGVDIGSRRKRAAYMKAHGLADASDYTNHLQKKQAERAAFFRGEKKDPGIRKAMIQAMQSPRRRK